MYFHSILWKFASHVEVSQSQTLVKAKFKYIFNLLFYIL